MNKKQVSDLIQKTFPEAFDKGRFGNFAINVLNRLDESKAQQGKKEETVSIRFGSRKELLKLAQRLLKALG
ncbi:MAG: hypothetical protein P9M00_06230 [Candidatus Tritonobacter lacicola]|nr:hypothetical protein [Candidatus Tritonobacter lacicola]